MYYLKGGFKLSSAEQNSYNNDDEIVDALVATFTRKSKEWSCSFR